MVNIVLTNWSAFCGNQVRPPFVNRHVSLIKVILLYINHCLSQSSLSGHKLVVCFQVRCGCLWLKCSCSIIFNQWGFAVSLPPPRYSSSCTASQMTGSQHTRPDCSLTPSNPAASPAPCIEYSEKNEERKCQREGVGWVEGAFNWIIPSAVITPIALKRPAIMEPCKGNFQKWGGLGAWAGYTVLAGFIPTPVCQPPMSMSPGEFVQLHLQYKFNKSLWDSLEISPIILMLTCVSQIPALSNARFHGMAPKDFHSFMLVKTQIYIPTHNHRPINKWTTKSAQWSRTGRPFCSQSFILFFQDSVISIILFIIENILTDMLKFLKWARVDCL